MGEALSNVLVTERTPLADGVVELAFADPRGAALPPWEPGAHIDVAVQPPGAEPSLRQYSLCGDPADATTYRIAVLREAAGTGGSAWIHDALHVGRVARVSAPRSTFRFRPRGPLVFVAGGIGVTPIVPMIRAADAAGIPWELHYAGRSRPAMAYAGQLAARGERVRLYPKDVRPLSVPAVVAALEPGAAVYACGPDRLLSELEERMSETPNELHVERFDNPNEQHLAADHAFEVDLSVSGRSITVEPGRSILETLAECGIQVPSSCRGGTCGTCETFVVSGEVDHRDAILTPAEKEESEVMMICVSRARGDRLVLEL